MSRSPHDRNWLVQQVIRTVKKRHDHEPQDKHAVLLAARRNGRGSTALVTNVDFKEWTDYLGDPPLAMALLDRVVDGAIIQKFRGKSYRAHRAERKGKQGARRA